MKKFLLVVCFLLYYSCVYAGLSVTPSVTNIVGEPGAEYKGEYSVKNTYDRPIYINVEVSAGNCFSENKVTDTKDWVKFEKDRYFIPAGEKVTVPYEILILDKFKGSVSSRISFIVEQEEGQMISISISVPIYVTVKGTENIDFDIYSVDLYSSEKNVSCKMELENKGNVHIRHSGSIEIYNKNKKILLKTIPIQETVPTYCESKRDFNEVLFSKSDLKKGKYVAVFKVRALGKEVSKEIKFKVLKNGNVVKL